MYRNSFIVLVFVLSLTLSGCQLSDLQSLVDTQQVITGEPTWAVDGDTYTTTTTYETAEGEESNSFILIIKNGTIKSVDVEILTEIKASIKYQKDFAAGISDIVVGKKISELEEIDIVSGASNTTSAFNEAISRLKTELNS